MFKRFALAVSLIGMVQFAQASWEEASQTMARVTDQMLVLVTDPEMRKPESIDPLMQQVDSVMADIVDYDYIGKSVMGKFVRRASDEEIQRFSDVFKNTILRTFAKAVSGFEFNGYSMVPPAADSPEPDKQIVSVDLSAANGQTYSLVYYMVREPRGWVLVNVLVDGINLRVTFRNQFANLMEQHSSISEVIDRWADAMSNVVENGA